MKEQLPDMYKWLEKEQGPLMMRAALKHYGLLEVKGKESNPTIMEWAEYTGMSPYYSDDSVPWCGLFMAYCAKVSGYVPPNIAVRAKEWAKFGVISTKPMLGDILVFVRDGGGHVGIYVGEDKEAYHVLGGNQSDKVCIARIERNRLYAARRCKWRYAQPKNVRVVKYSGKGDLSRNEA